MSGADPVTPEMIGAINRYNPIIVGQNPHAATLTVQGAWGQTAALQTWRNGNGVAVANVTQHGAAFFSEMGIASRPGASVVSLFFEPDGSRQFALSANAQTFDIFSYSSPASAAYYSVLATKRWAGLACGRLGNWVPGASREDRRRAYRSSVS